MSGMEAFKKWVVERKPKILPYRMVGRPGKVPPWEDIPVGWDEVFEALKEAISPVNFFFRLRESNYVLFEDLGNEGVVSCWVSCKPRELRWYWEEEFGVRGDGNEKH